MYFGAATSSYQIEGGINNADWSKFKDAGVACNSWNKFSEDVKLLKEIGCNAYRFSLEWSRIEPKEGIFDEKAIEKYATMAKTLKDNNIEPFITLWHFTLPQWLADKGGVLNNKFCYYFLRYIKKVVPLLSQDVTYFITVNEPTIYIEKGYLEKSWPPLEKNLYNCVKAYFALIKTHNKSYRYIHSLCPQAKVSIAHGVNWHYGHNFLGKIVAKAIHYFNDTFFLSSLKLDYIGLNYYMRCHIKNLSYVGWNIYPEGLFFILRSLNKYHLPIIITENGIANSSDEKRADFISQHLNIVKRAISENINIQGYFHWSLLDNFEWAEGYKQKFGLATCDRILKPSAFIYKKLIAEFI